MKDLVIIGGGAAGLASLHEAKLSGIKDVLLIEKDEYLGGILNQCIHNGFGLKVFKEELTGPEYSAKFCDLVKDYQDSILLDTTVIEITKDKEVVYSNQEGIFKVKTKTIMICTGALERTASMINLLGDRPTGVMTAGLAQRYINIDGYLPGKRAFILGSGDIGLIMARRLVLEGIEVVGVAEIMPYSNGLTRNVVQCLDDYNIPLKLSTTVSKVYGDARLEKIEIAKVDENFKVIEDTKEIIEVDLLLLSVGLIPLVNLLKPLNLKEYSKTRSLVVDEFNQTSLPGLFIAGNSLHIHDLVDNVSLEAVKAISGVKKYLEGLDAANYREVKNGEGVSYVLPNLVSELSNEVELSFRVSNIYKDAVVRVSQNGEVIKEVKKIILVPSEMEVIKVKLKDKTGDLVIQIV